MSLVINLRGTNGSGKSTLARAQIPGKGTEIVLAGVKCLAGSEVCLIGPYPEGKTGGCDRVHTFEQMRGAILEASQKYRTVIFESVTVSTVFSSWAEFCLRNVPFWWVYLDTPLEVCLTRIRQRNGGAPFNADMVMDKCRAIARTRNKALLAGLPVFDLHYEKAQDELEALALLG